MSYNPYCKTNYGGCGISSCLYPYSSCGCGKAGCNLCFPPYKWVNSCGCGSPGCKLCFPGKNCYNACGCNKAGCVQCFPAYSWATYCTCKKPGCKICFPAYPLANPGSYKFANKCGCKKPSCSLCFPAFCNYPGYNPAFNSGCSSPFSSCGYNANSSYGYGAKNACIDPYAQYAQCYSLYGDPCSSYRKFVTWQVQYLVSNNANQARNVDLNLVNPWGIIIAEDRVWVALGEEDAIGVYDFSGNSVMDPIDVRDASHNSSFPTGLAWNNCGGFAVSNGTATRPAKLLTCSEHGTVHAWAPGVDATAGYTVINQQNTGVTVVYKGMALANNTLYLADFFGRKVDVFDSGFNQIVSYPFIDNDIANPLPPDYGPNNIVHIGCYLFVLYARQDPNLPIHDLDGPGNGYINIFTLDGIFVRRFVTRGELNSPWGMIPAPCECGFPKDTFLIGNNGDGNINIYNANGVWFGKLMGQGGIPIVIEGLWGLAAHYKCKNEIYFASSLQDENELGLIGKITRSQIIAY